MVKLVPMKQADFSAYLERGIAEYAEDKVKSGNWTVEEALERSRKEFEKYLPDGLQSKNEYIFSIVDEADDQKVGMLWVEVKMDSTSHDAFIFDFRVEEQFRGKGYGKQALAALDEKLISMNVDSVGLHVFGHNIVAQELYKKSGYEITNINMRKVLRKTDLTS
jgi:ribosomal protein S18 acetylase RimI-like enzyme